MSEDLVETRSVVMERELAHPPEKVWRALTQPHLIGEWLMNADIEATPGRRFTFRADWGQVECQILTAEPPRSLSYTWVSSGLDSVVTWTLEPVGAGTHLRMEQAGFRPDQEQAFQGAKFGWPRFLAKLDGVLARED